MKAGLLAFVLLFYASERGDDGMKRIAEAKLTSISLHEPTVRELEQGLSMRSDLHLARKLWHFGMGLFIVLVYLMSGMSTGMAVMILGSFLGLDLMVETARLRIPAFNEQVLKYWGPFMRECEVTRMSGTPYYILAALLALAIFPKPVAILSILFLAVGDPIASVVGILYGRKSIKIANGKSLIGTLGGVISCMMVTLAFLKVYPVPVSEGVWLSLGVLGGLSGGLAELAPFDMDDNFTIPIISGFVMWLAFIVFAL